jgi:hypothetical protein
MQVGGFGGENSFPSDPTTLPNSQLQSNIDVQATKNIELGKQIEFSSFSCFRMHQLPEWSSDTFHH